MGEQANLRSVLSQTENSSSAIQNSAASMMKLYIISPALAVSEWRNALQSSRNSQLLPLLYVANEVIQSSKRNRGNKFLEQFSPVLKGSLQFICERDPEVVEKVRRVAKIWGDRRVFSVRFVADLLSGVEEFRNFLNLHNLMQEKRKRMKTMIFNLLLFIIQERTKIPSVMLMTTIPRHL